MPDNSWLDYLEEQPHWRTAYFGFEPQFGAAPAQRRYYQNQFQRIQDEFIGKQAQQILGGGVPSLRFTDFLGQYPWTQRYAQLPPSMRGENPSLFNPFTRRFFF